MSLEKNVDGLIAKHDLKMGILRLEIDNQKSKNAIKTSAFKAMTKIFRQAGVEKDVRLVYLTGKGDNYYSSGKDLSDVLEDGDPFQKLDDGMEIWRDFVDSLIDCERLVVVGVNGPVVGAACTTLALADLVYCSSKATFWTPFTKMGIVAEGCSTYTFPRLMGRSKATEVLCMNKKLTASEALERNLVAEVIGHQEFRSEMEKRLESLSTMQAASFNLSSKMSKRWSAEKLHEVNAHESAALKQRFFSIEFFEALKDFLSPSL